MGFLRHLKIRTIGWAFVIALRAEMRTGGLIQHFKDFVPPRAAPRLEVVQERL